MSSTRDRRVARRLPQLRTAVAALATRTMIRGSMVTTPGRGAQRRRGRLRQRRLLRWHPRLTCRPLRATIPRANLLPSGRRQRHGNGNQRGPGLPRLRLQSQPQRNLCPRLRWLLWQGLRLQLLWWRCHWRFLNLGLWRGLLRLQHWLRHSSLLQLAGPSLQRHRRRLRTLSLWGTKRPQLPLMMKILMLQMALPALQQRSFSSSRRSTR